MFAKEIIKTFIIIVSCIKAPDYGNLPKNENYHIMIQLDSTVEIFSRDLFNTQSLKEIKKFGCLNFILILFFCNNKLIRVFFGLKNMKRFYNKR